MIRRFAGWMLVSLALFSSTQAKEIVDMTGKTVDVPDKIEKVFSGSPPLTYMIYAIDPLMLSGLNFRITEQERPFLSEKIYDLPLLGGFYGQGNIANSEMILKAKPDLILRWDTNDGSQSSKTEDLIMGKLPMPQVKTVFRNVYDYGKAFLFLGKLLGREERGRALSDYANNITKSIDEKVRAIPEAERPTVYYAEGTEGLNTDCDTSWHAELIGVAGARNVYHCAAKDNYGMERVNMEQVMLFNPDVILVQDRAFFDKIFKDPIWQDIKAVKTKRVYLIPKAPFNWFDRPPSFMRLMGIQWLMHNLYPERYDVDIIKEAKEFYRLFLGVNKTDEEMRAVIHP
jgi:iron complex transport system substrate-binding protein